MTVYDTSVAVLGLVYGNHILNVPAMGVLPLLLKVTAAEMFAPLFLQRFMFMSHFEN